MQKNGRKKGDGFPLNGVEPEEDLVLLDLGEATGENGNIPNIEVLEDMVDMIVEIINQDLVVQFTKESGTKDYKVWPEIADISVVSRNQIVRQLEQPETVILGRNFYMKFD
ncbi:Hypothetical predicted protein [Mytilus galloprovincialis]|uniref:Uncharacterized protein n=1 Tax=Mytilus galloprovincialis TaxID=29158 RepID=A0A8B6HNR9_MYTGA|nr:Hypothetical predicted protein [Mytilus galloprovincialis]